MFQEGNKEDEILRRMLDKLEDQDKRESSVAFNILAPIALELARAYSDLDRYLEYAFPNLEVPEEYIEKRALEVGLERKQAAFSLRKAMFFDDKNNLMDIPLDTRFSIEGLNFKAIEKISKGIYKLQCEIKGTIGNEYEGRLIPIDYIEGLAVAELGEVLERGKDIESAEDLFNRLSNKIKNPTTSGNSNHYKQWALEVNGVGKAKVFPLWQGEGSVKIVITDSNRMAPSDELINNVFSHIQDLKPIGPKITVAGAMEKQINVSSKVILANGFNIAQVQQEFTKLIKDYLKDIAFELSYVSIAKVGNILLNTPGVLDYQNLSINGVTSNLGLQEDEIPVLKALALEV